MCSLTGLQPTNFILQEANNLGYKGTPLKDIGDTLQTRLNQIGAYDYLIMSGANGYNIWLYSDLGVVEFYNPHNMFQYRVTGSDKQFKAILMLVDSVDRITNGHRNRTQIAGKIYKLVEEIMSGSKSYAQADLDFVNYMQNLGFGPGSYNGSFSTFNFKNGWKDQIAFE